MEDPRLAGGNYTSKEERLSILAKYDKVSLCIYAYFKPYTKYFAELSDVVHLFVKLFLY